MSCWVYVFDMFKLVDIDPSELRRLVEEDPMKLFDRIKEVFEGVEEIKDVRVHDVFIDPQSNEFLIEYIVKHRNGETPVKVIHFPNPVTMLRKYCEYEYKKGLM